MKSNLSRLAEHKDAIAGKNAEEILRWAAQQFPRLAFATSLGLEDQVLLDMICRNRIRASIFTLDTGRLFPQTYDLIAQTEARYGIRLRLLFPDASEVEELVNSYGVNCFRRSIDLRKACCHVRKVLPLKRALAGFDAWICGLRRQQSISRKEVEIVAWDEINNLIKIAPLAGWAWEDIRSYVREHQVPYNPLHDEGYPTIGCACCTRPVAPGKDPRAGRWWWEAANHKECGLHNCPRLTAHALKTRDNA